MTRSVHTLVIISIVLVLQLVRQSEPRPVKNANGKTCNVSKEFLNQLKDAIQKTAKKRPPKFEATNVGNCESDLQAIVASLNKIYDETNEARDKVPVDRINEVKESFEANVEKLVRSEDILNATYQRELTETRGEMYDTIYNLKLDIEKLNADIIKAREVYFATVITLIAEQVSRNQADNQTLEYAKKIPAGEISTFIEQVEQRKNYTLLFECLQILKHLKDEGLNRNVFESLIENMNAIDSGASVEAHERGKRLLVVFFCWVANQDDVVGLYRAKLDTVKQLAVEFFGQTKDREHIENEVNGIKSEVKTCSYRLPATWIPSYAISG